MDYYAPICKECRKNKYCGKECRAAKEERHSMVQDIAQEIFMKALFKGVKNNVRSTN